MEEEKKENKKSDAALREEKVLEFWREHKIFQKSLEKKSPKGEYIFYDGPVTSNSKPVLHTMEPFSFKDVLPRYKTMRGYHVRRKGGWDTHGLPVELQIEKKLGFKSKTDIENYGIAAFNKLCKDSVWEYIGLWKAFTERMGYWADQENAYVTYHNSYMESLWYIVKKINEQGLLYKDYKVVPWCPRCGTALSSHELAQGYEDDKDLSVTAKFKVKNPEKIGLNGDVYILAWTTTPWTLPGNVGLAVGLDIDYLLVENKTNLNRGIEGGELNLQEGWYIFAKNYFPKVVKEGNYFTGNQKEIKGKDLVGLEYEPLYPYLGEVISEKEKPKMRNAYKVYPADFVTTVDGTGVVHTAVMYGQDDFVLGTKVGLPKHHLVGLDGKFLPGTGPFAGRFVKDEEVAVDVIKDLAHRGLLFSKEKYEHSYPHCWRCHTALIYYARDSWYIRMSDKKIKEKMIAENRTINWEPAYIREGRFGEWLREIKDWAISRERYWGTPLPVWDCHQCHAREVIGSIEDLKNKTKKSGNRYFLMRHGEAVDNARHLDDPQGDPDNHLTENGKKETLAAAKKLKKEKIDLVFSSPFLRTRETAEVLGRELGLSAEQVVIDERIHEYNESNRDAVKKRMGDFLYDIENKFQNKNILIVSHGSPIWFLQSVARGIPHADFIEKEMLETGGLEELLFVPLPHNENYELDLHKPYIDEIKLVCPHLSCGGDLVRTKEVMDVWFDSGAMPFAQDHYPFENKKWVDGPGYPADFISEAIDQTRGWFYTLHAVGTLMGRGKAYKNVICLGHLLDASGKKMSKSVGNIVDPWAVMDKYGVDTLRLWMYSVNQPGESKNFDEKTVVLLHQQVFGLLYNVLAFYELYKDLTPAPLLAKERGEKSSNVLDVWILARLNELIKSNTENLDNYKLLEPVRAIRDFVGDLSTWYLRRSRERIKSSSAHPRYAEGSGEARGSGGTRDGNDARQTLYFVLKTLAKLLAPFAPFAAEDIWLKLKNDKDAESVHLCSWPLPLPGLPLTKGEEKEGVLMKMQKTREIVTLALEQRQKAKIPVRQPLSQLKIKNYELEIGYAELIKDELNVKEIKEDKDIDGVVELDTNITPALQAEGEYREFMRELNDRRKKLGLNPGDKMAMDIETIYKKYKTPKNLQEHMLRVAAVASVVCDNIKENVDKENIITACLLHDMGNIVKYDLGYFPQFLEPQGLEYWQNVQKEFREKYSKDEHQVTALILKEIGLSDEIIRLASGNGFGLLCKSRDENDIPMKMMHYTDNRVSPFGIVSYDERMEEAGGRYKNRADNNIKEEERLRLVSCGKDIEKQIFAKCKIKPEDINDETVAPIIAELRKFVIK